MCKLQAPNDKPRVFNPGKALKWLQGRECRNCDRKTIPHRLGLQFYLRLSATTL
jgi:hypothetical protein